MYEYGRITTNELYDKDGSVLISLKSPISMICPYDSEKYIFVERKYYYSTYTNKLFPIYYEGKIAYVPQRLISPVLLAKGDYINVKGTNYEVIGSGAVMYRAVSDEGKIIRRNYLDRSGRLTFSLATKNNENLKICDEKYEHNWQEYLTAVHMYKPYDNEEYTQNILKNFNLAINQKQNLINILSKHANWNNKELCVEIPISIPKSLNQEELNAASRNLFAYLMDLKIYNKGMIDDMNTLLSYCTCDYSYVEEDGVNKFRKSNTISILQTRNNLGSFDINQKASRVIMKICNNLGFYHDKKFEQLFAEFSDALSIKSQKYKFILSVNPADFITMSHGNSWTSCHSFVNGNCYHAGSVSYANDDVTMIAYIIPENATGEYYKIDKIRRQLFMLHKSNMAIIQSKMYPKNSDKPSISCFRESVLKIINECGVNIQNKTCIIHAISKPGSLQYPDYSYGYCVPLGETQSSRLEIGNIVYNIRNGAVCRNHNSLINVNGVKNLDKIIIIPENISKPEEQVQSLAVAV